MLTQSQVAVGESQPDRLNEQQREAKAQGQCENRWRRVFRVEWLGQTVASLCWIASVLAYGISETGDWLQLLAASAWLLANLAAVLAFKAD